MPPLVREGKIHKSRLFTFFFVWGKKVITITAVIVIECIVGGTQAVRPIYSACLFPYQVAVVQCSRVDVVKNPVYVKLPFIEPPVRRQNIEGCPGTATRLEKMANRWRSA